MLVFSALLGAALAAPPDLIARPAGPDGAGEVVLRYGRGAAEDPPGRSGLTHLAEHLALSTEAARALEAQGGEVEGRTTHDEVRLTLRAPASLVSALEAAAIAALDPGAQAWPDEVWRLERDHAHTEALASAHSEAALRGLALYPPGHPYHRPAAGLPDDIGQATLSDASGWLGSALAPSLVAVELVGLEATDALRARLVEALVPPPSPPRPIASAWGRVWRAACPSAVQVLAWPLGTLDEAEAQDLATIVSIFNDSIQNDSRLGPSGPAVAARVPRRLGDELVVRVEVREAWAGRLLGLGSGRAAMARLARRVDRALTRLVRRPDGVGAFARARLGPQRRVSLSLGPGPAHWPREAEELPLR